MSLQAQNYEHFLVLDFEATCIKDMRINPQEIIEISCTVCHVRGDKLVTDEKFQSFVKPVYRSKLSPFCIKLTSITQETVDKANKFSEVFAEFVQWAKTLNLAGKRAIFVTCGDWDLDTMLPSQCELSKVPHPDFTKSRINLKKEYERVEGTTISRADNDLLQMMKCYHLDFEGVQHKGLDDVHNICRLLEAMCAKATLQATERHDSFVEGKMPEIVWEPEAAQQQQQQQEEEGEESGGAVTTLSSHVKTHLAMKRKQQKYDYILVLDFEATCLKDMKIDPQEIIEFPCVVLETRTYDIKDVFHHYVQPVKRPHLSPFCTKLTGITQRMVDESKTFPEVFQQFLDWVSEETKDDKKFIVATCGDWDLKTMLPSQLRLSEMADQAPNYLKRWINVKKVFEVATNTEIYRGRNDLQQMMEALGLTAMGTLHSGIDDVKNIAKVIEALSHFTVLEATTD